MTKVKKVNIAVAYWWVDAKPRIFQISQRRRRKLQLRRRPAARSRRLRGPGLEGGHEVLLLHHGLQLCRVVRIHEGHRKSGNEK